MGGRLATSVAVVVAATILAPGDARAGEDDLTLDLGSASDKQVDGGAPLRKLELRRIPSGTFVQGSPPTDIYREPEEVQRNVTISRSFWMGKYPIMRGQFARFVAETRHQTDAEKSQSGGAGWDGVRLKQDKQYNWRNPGFAQKDDDPVTLVTFGDANAFTAWASRKTGRRVRLPTEAEFEYAARAGTTTPWYGAKTEEEAAAIGWFRPQPGAAVGTHPVGKKPPNPFGLYDMTGNVNEWTRDVYAVWPATDVTDPENTAHAGTEPERRVLRGGSWMRDPRRGRSAARYRNTAGTRNADNGFRVVVEDAPVIAPPPGVTPANDVTPAPSFPLPSTDAGPAIAPPPPVMRQSTGTEGSSWGFLVAPAGAAGFVVAWMLARRKSGAHTNAQGITTRAGADGFWVRAPNLPPGARVRYTCIVRGREVSDVVPLDGGVETFVFTGDAPSMIRITDSVATPAQISYRQVAPPAPGSSPSVAPPLPPGSSRSIAPPLPPGSSPSVAPPLPPGSSRSIAPPLASGSTPTLQRSPWPSDRGSSRSVSVVPAASSRMSASPPVLPSGPPPPALPSGPPAPPSDRGSSRSVSVVPAASSRMSASPPALPSGPPAPPSEPFIGYPGAYR